MATTKELLAEYNQKKGELNQFVEQHTNAEGNLDFSVAELKAFNDRNAELAPLYDVYQASATADRNAAELKKVDPEARRKLFGDSDHTAAAELKSLGELIMSHELYSAYSKVESLGGGSSNKFAFDIPSVTLNDLMKGSIAASLRDAGMNDMEIKATITTGLGVIPYPAQQPGVVGYPTRDPMVADIIPQGTTDSPIILYVEETAVTRSAATVAEGAVKPQSDFTLTRQQVNVQVIAHKFKLSNQALEDIPGLRDRLDMNGTLGLALAEETQILTGDGSTPNLQGFLTKSGVQTQAVGGDDRFTAFRKAMTLVQAVGFANVSGAIFNVYDWQEYLTTKDANGRFIFGDPGAMTQLQRLWGVPSIGTVAMTQGTALLGDFQRYSKLWRKGGVRVINGWSGDDIDRNLQTFVIEERVALEIDRASAFCKVTGLTLS